MMGVALMNNQTGLEEVNSFGDWLRQRRKTLDWSQAVLAQRAGCTAATIRKIEADERKPSWQLAELLATALGVPADGRTTFVQAARQLRPVTQLPPANQAPVAAAPFLLSSPKFPHNLPASMTSLVDRVRDAATVVQLLKRADVRLLTLLGPPGIGKTRLSIYTAEQLAAYFRDGIWFVDLAPINDASLVLSAIAYVLSVAEVGITLLLDRLRTTLAEKELLLVLDNFEQVGAAAPEVATLLRGCKGLKVLATSRTPLLLAGEHEYAVPPLSLPPSTLVTDSASDNLPEKLLSYEAVQLFIARVRQYQQDFAITPTNAAQISTICLRLDGIPLALELAAAALRRITLTQLAVTFQHEASWLSELHSPARDLPPRQQTLSNAIAWSYRLLDADAQSAFRQLGIFVGGFTADAAQAVCGADQSTLARLTDHSLLARAPERWRMLEMIREFALAQMGSAERMATQQSYIAYFVAQPTTNPDTVAPDNANFRGALLVAIAAHDIHAALTLCIKLAGFWQTYGYWREGITLTRSALAMPDKGNGRLRVDALESVASLVWQHHQLDTALEFAEQALTLARSRGHPEELALVLNLLGRIFIEQGDYTRAATVLAESAAFASQVPHLFNPGCPFAQLGEVALARADWVAAQTYLAQAVSYLASDQGLPLGVFIAIAHTILAEVALAFSNPNEARHELRQALPAARLLFRRMRCLLVTLAGLLLTTVHTTPAEDAQAAAALLGAEAGLGEQMDAPSLLLYQALITERSASVQRLLTPLEWQAAWQRGHAWTLAQAVDAAEGWLEVDSEG
jgi:predicted ATPase/DNA-binding XRE family transcriptional regulator